MGQVTCPSCGGNGKVKCSNCNGTGGYWRTSGGEKFWEQCSLCWGSGKTTCNNCNGNGKINTF